MITREDEIEQSVEDFVKDKLIENGYGLDKVKVRDAFPTVDERATEMTQTVVALGFNFDDGGRKIELGSDLTMRTYFIEFWTFGRTPGQGRNVANAIRAFLEEAGMVPLKDIGVEGHPVIDQILVSDDRGITVQKQINPDPRPWDKNVYTTKVKMEDTYSPSLTN